MPALSEAPELSEVHYTAFIRVPFARGDFVDPPQIDWDGQKDQALWQILSRSSRTSDLNWKELATRFEVPLSFILQQAAWLYERQLSQVRDQMRRVGKGDASGNESDRSVGASPQQGVRLSNLAGEAGTLDGTASGVRQRRVSLDKNVAASPISRSTSSNTDTHARKRSSPQVQHMRTATNTTTNRRGSSTNAESSKLRTKSSRETKQPEKIRSNSPAIASSSSSDSERETEKNQQVSRPQPYRRPSRFNAGGRPSFSRQNPPTEAEDEIVFLPFANRAASQMGQGSVATLRQIKHPQSVVANDPVAKTTTKPEQIEYASPTSSASSAATPVSPAEVMKSARTKSTQNPPSSTVKGSALSTGKKRDSKTGSDESPGVGSSFSDLDDPGVTQSALEEAVLSKMQREDLSSRTTSTNSTGQSGQSRGHGGL